MDSASRILELVKREPWRMGQGRARNALHAGWKEDPVICAGEIEFEQGTKWWCCLQCGHCSFWSNTTHYKPDNPQDYYQDSLEFFYAQKQKQGISQEEARLQAFHVTGIALRIAAMLQPNQLSEYVDTTLIKEN